MDASSTLTVFGERQQRLLALLLESKAGLGADELAEQLAISRSAVHQHLMALERDGYVHKRARASRGGRPGFAWSLSDGGVHLFAKQYALFSDLLIRALQQKLGRDALVALLREIGAGLARDHLPSLREKTLPEQVETVVEIMRKLGYEARAAKDPGNPLPLIDARNCIYHHLAREHPEVCELDLALLSTLLDADIDHLECMVRGGGACRFRVRKHSPTRRSTG